MKSDTPNDESIMPERDAIWAKHDGLTPALAAELLVLSGRLEQERDAARKQISENPWCAACKERHCVVSGDGTCAMIRKYLAIPASLFKVEYADNGKQWLLWKDGMTLEDANDLSAKIETVTTRVVPMERGANED